MRRLLAGLLAGSLLLSSGVEAKGKGLSQYDEQALRRMLYIRGHDVCASCSKAELVSRAEAVAQQPANRALEEEYEADLLYEKKRAGLHLSKEEFLIQMSKSHSSPPSTKAADRLWHVFQAQLDSGGVEFHEDGRIAFALPVTHFLAPHIPEALADTIEAAHAQLLALYLRLPKEYRSWAQRLADAGGFYVALAALAAMIAIDLASDDPAEKPAVGKAKAKAKAKAKKTN